MTNPSLLQTHEQRRIEELLLKLAHSEGHRPAANATSYCSIDYFETVTACLTQMEATVLGLKELRSYAGTRISVYMLAILIEEAEAKITEIKRRITQ